MIVRAQDLATKMVLELDITAEIPVQKYLTPLDCTKIFPKQNGKPQSLTTIKRWIKSGELPSFKLGGQVFVDPTKIGDVSMKRAA